MASLEAENGPKIYGEVCYRKQRRKRQKLLIIELLYEYAKNSTLHGLRYIVDRALQVYEQIFWLLTFMMSMGMCFFLISKVYTKWNNSPVIVSFSEKVVPVGEVPFPSVTICPEMKSNASVYDYSKELTKYLKIREGNDSIPFTEKEWYYLHDIDVACNGQVRLQTPRNLTNSSLIEHFYEVVPSIDNMFHYCSWRGQEFNCSDFFASVVTAEGICYNFNSLAADEILRLESKNLQSEYKYLSAARPSRNWKLSNGYKKYSDPKETYPKRGSENTAFPDLIVVLQESQEDRDGLCNSLRSGYKIFVQHPADLPQSSLYYYAALPGQVSSLALKFSKVTTDDALEGYNPEIRQCYFLKDKQLRYFHIYTPNNCRLECQSNITFELCQCVWYHMPHNDSRQLCISENSYKCMLQALDSLSLAELNGNESTCKCLPSCNSVQYDAEILKTNFNTDIYLNTLKEVYNWSDVTEAAKKNYSRIEIYFKEPRFVSMRRSELFGITDFLAACGGLLGLFLGFSFLSLVEIFYFGTLRLYTILKRDLKEEKENRKKEKS